ncbi:hypothetical protein [uncultured Methanobrevibacter sp.]|uniref:hypothetical protein n=1 Tax=uncultured Methanobrevibacter sp. TaxID=253161 RepID=UPI0025EB436D|nr:hypothetical protein [uncultured Methanobrevibacter sp.]
MKLESKYVLHIPESKFIDNELIPLKTDDLIKDLIEKLNINGYENLYLSKIKGYYKGRSFDETVITIFIDRKRKKSTLPDEIFIEWFKKNNHTLKQESFAYEVDNSLYIEKLDTSKKLEKRQSP